MVVPGEGRARTATTTSQMVRGIVQESPGDCGCAGVNRSRDYRKGCTCEGVQPFLYFAIDKQAAQWYNDYLVYMALYAQSIGSLHTYCAALRAKSYKKAAHSAAFLYDFCAG